MSRLSRLALAAAVSASFCGNAFGHNDHFGGVNSNFNNAQAYSWTLISAGSVVVPGGFDPNSFTVGSTTDFRTTGGVRVDPGVHHSELLRCRPDGEGAK